MSSTPQRRRTDGFFERGHQVTRLEAFVDAAFAFALTLLAISIDSVPGNREELIVALKGVPAFAASFIVICLFWWDHNEWSRLYGLDDGRSIFLSLLFVFLILIYVYPLKLMFSAMFAWLSSDWLPSTYLIGSLDDLQLMYVVYAIAFASLGLVMFALKWHAYSSREKIGLDALETLLSRRELWRASWLPAAALVSLLLASQMHEDQPHWTYSLPGLCYWLLLGQAFMGFVYRQQERSLREQLADATA